MGISKVFVCRYRKLRMLLLSTSTWKRMGLTMITSVFCIARKRRCEKRFDRATISLKVHLEAFFLEITSSAVDPGDPFASKFDISISFKDCYY